MHSTTHQNPAALLAEAPAELSDSYRALAQQALGLFSGQRHRIANAANLSALVYHTLPDLNWVGFYFLETDLAGGNQPVLMVGPFQGKPACVRIEIGRGVCGQAVATRSIQRVADVHAFEGHIACDPDSRSELVVPLEYDGEVYGVFDIDSPKPDRFSRDDEVGLAYLATLFSASFAHPN